MPCQVSYLFRVSLKSSEIDVPVRLNGVSQEVVVTPGDIILGDAGGVVLLPRHLADDVLKLLPKLVAGIPYLPCYLTFQADEKVLKDVSRGMSVQEAFDIHRGKL